MNKTEITSHLKNNHDAFIHCIESLNEAEYNFAKEGKWNAGQTLDHLRRAVSTLSAGIMLPKFFFSLLFGKAKRPSGDYEGVVLKYREILAAGAKAHGRYLPKKVSFPDRQKKFAALRKSVAGICNTISGYSEEDLDHYILPHPLLGKITIREMMYFTIYHAEHHRSIIIRELQKNL